MRDSYKMNNKLKRSVAAQLSLDGKADQALLSKSARRAAQLKLTPRDIELLRSIYDWGGVMTTGQVSQKHWPPDMRRRLHGYGLMEHEIEAVIATYSASHINQELELHKWLKAVQRLKDTTRSSKPDEKLREYLYNLNQRSPHLFAEVESAIAEVEQIGQSTWLKRRLQEGKPRPCAFVDRPLLPSDFVSSACKSRLKALADSGLIEPYEQPTRLSEGRAQACWFLTKRGCRLLADLMHTTVKDMDFKPAGAYGTYHLSHRLALNDVRIAIELGCDQKGYQLVRWVDDNQLKRLLATEKVTLVRLVYNHETGDRTEVSEHYNLKIPDGYFCLDMGAAGQRHCFFEFDNQTLTIADTKDSAKDFAQKIRTISAFYKSGRYKEVFPEADGSMWYLTITSGGDKRMMNLKQTAERVIGLQNKALDRYWFTTTSRVPTWEDYYSAAVFTPIWQRAGQERWWSLDDASFFGMEQK